MGVGGGGWVVGDCENKVNSAQLWLAGALAELGNIRVDQQSLIKYLPQYMLSIVMSVEVVTKNYDENL